MTTYGILVVDTSWTNQDSVQIDKTTHLRHEEHFAEGAKALIYMRQPVDAVVAEAELMGKVIQMETKPEEPVSASAWSAREPLSVEQGTEPGAAFHLNQAMEKTFWLPLKVVRLKGKTEPIPINRLQIILGRDFTVFDETWLPLSEAQYSAITALWEKA